MARSSVDRRLRMMAALARGGLEQQRYTHFSLIVGSASDNWLELTAGPRLSGPASVSTHKPSVFDLASLTKPIATASSVLLLSQGNALRLQDPLRRFFPTLAKLPLGALPVKSLLTHTSGLPAWLNLHAPPVRGARRRACIFEQPLAQPRARYVYSDLGFMLLGDLVSVVSQQSIARFAREALFKPLAMSDTRFVPPPDTRQRCVPTEHAERSLIRDEKTGRRLQGVVHDENCRAAGGVSGHAGLFATANDVARFARNLVVPGPEIFARPALQRMRKNQIEGIGGSTCGWFTVPNQMLPGLEAFRKENVHAFGHTGFTGTSLVVAPEQRLFIVLLTNRVYYGRVTPEFYALRRKLHGEFARLCSECG